MRFARVTTTFVIGLMLWVQNPSRAAEPESGKKYLIVHADDAGMCHSANLGTIEALAEHPEHEALAGFPPDWASHIEISCSS